MILLQQAITEGKWLLFTDNKTFHFKLKPLAFEKLNLDEIDTSDDSDEDDDEVQDEGGAYWLFKVEVISLCKKKIRTSQVTEDIGLVDQDGFRFDVKWKSSMTYSKFGKRSGLSRFYGEEILPKIRAVGAVSFFLPDDEEAVYSVTNINGKIHFADDVSLASLLGETE